MNWYVVKTKPKKEKDVLHQLERLPGEPFLPLIQGPVSPKPLFPSYLFARMNLGDPYLHRMVRYTKGVSRILGDSEGPQPVSDIIVETLREKCLRGSIIERDLLFKPGDQVRIKRGLLRDLIGMIDKGMSDSGRVKILFKWLNTTMSAVLKYTDLEKVS